MLADSVIPEIIDQHAEESAFLWLLRRAAVGAPHYNLSDLRNLDQRVEAHIDGLRIAGDMGWKVCKQNLDLQESGEIFTAAVLAYESNDIDRLQAVHSIVEATPDTVSALVSAIGWVGADRLKGKVVGLLASKKAFWRQVGITACAIHRIDPGRYLDEAIDTMDLACCSRALRAVGELGRVTSTAAVLKYLKHDDERCRFWASWSAVLTGNRGIALDCLQSITMSNSIFQQRSLQLLLRVLNAGAAQNLLRKLKQHPEWSRQVVIAAGVCGDPVYVPWLIEQMKEPALARVSGEACSFITGVDIAYEDLDRERPDRFKVGPTENPEDENVDMDADEDLPFPDALLIREWWDKNQSKYNSGTRYLMGQPVTGENCQRVLREGYQRQRSAAAMELALMKSDAVLFETRAPGIKQQFMLGLSR